MIHQLSTHESLIGHLREVEPADLGARPARGREPDGHAGPHEGAVDLPRAQARRHAPDVLKRVNG